MVCFMLDDARHQTLGCQLDFFTGQVMISQSDFFMTFNLAENAGKR